MEYTSFTSNSAWKVCLDYLSDASVSEIESNGYNGFYLKKSGIREHLGEIDMKNDESYLQDIENSLIPLIKTHNTYKKNSYLFEGPIDVIHNNERIRGRVHIVLPPASDVPQVTIAKKSTSLLGLTDIARKGSMAVEMQQFIEACVQANLNIVISGATGAGKSTMMEACTKNIPNNIRIGVAEDTPELALSQPNVTYLHSVPWQPGMDANNVATLSWVVQQFQRMRIDRLIIGETRGKEFADFLVAANSGMDGSMTTIHANTPQRCLDKMTNFALKGSERQPIRAINNDIANTIDIIIQLDILHDGSHKIKEICEITKTISNNDDAKITTNPLYTYKNGQFFKSSIISDDLRQHFSDRNIDISKFLNSTVGSPLQSYSNNTYTTPINNNNYTSGLPTINQLRM